MRHIFERIKLRILSRNFDGASPAARAIKVVAVRIGHLSPIDLDGVIMKTFIQWPCVTVPGAVFAFFEFAAVAECAANAFGLWRHNAEPHATFRVVLRILFSRLVGRAGLPVIDWFSGLREAELA